MAHIAADLVVLLHFFFVLFVVLGGFLVLRRPRLIVVHLPAAVWGVAIEWGGWLCPLTTLENYLRRIGGGTVYQSGFIEHYVTPVLYPAGLEPRHQLVLGAVVSIVNAAVYRAIYRRWRQTPHAASSGAP